MRQRSFLTLALLLAGCNIQETSPKSQIDRLRVLSIRIDGPADSSGKPLAELKPGDAATLTPLILAPGITPLDDMTAAQDVCVEDYRALRWDRSASQCAVDGSPRVPVHRFWFWCPPQPATLYDDPCTNTDILSSPAAILNNPGIKPLGASCTTPPTTIAPSPTACVQPSKDLFKDLPPGDLTPKRGVLMSVLLVTVLDVDGDFPTNVPRLLEKIQANTIPSVVALKRVPVLENPTNHNPQPQEIRAATGPIQPNDSLDRVGGLTVGYENYPPQDPREAFTRVNADGSVESQVEKFDTAWFSGFGRFDAGHTLFDESNVYTPAKGSGIDLPPPGPGTSYPMPFAVVVRDGRGGEGWLLRSVLVPRR